MSTHVLLRLAGAGCVTVVLFAAAGTPSAQIAEQRLHLNPVIAKLAEGRTVYGLQAGIEMSIGSARAAMARFPPEADQSAWVVKQALDMGLHGVFFNGVDTPEQALLAVGYMRYPARRDAKYPQPRGVRGAGSGNATWIWGVTTDEYERHADLWPLNPDGDLLATMMIESVEGLANVDKIAATPGVGSLFLGAANDLAHSLGVPSDHPDVEMARQKILTACRTHKIACNITANTADEIVKRVSEGWHMIRTTVPAINAARARLKDPKTAPPPADPFVLPR